MDITLFNTLSREKETFKPLKKGLVGIYNCGPTVYDTPHIGNYRTFIMDDLIRRVFEYNEYTVTQVMNVTDVDDKTIKRSHEEMLSLQELTRKYEKLFLDGLHTLNIEKPEHLLRATENIQDMIDLIQVLLKKGIAYVSDDGIYFNVHAFKDYGALAGIDISEDPSGKDQRIANDEYDTSTIRDFALWKFKKSDDGDTFWPAPFGDGRPGWHIECSAMSMKVLGPTIDIHTAGTDLIFPHHTNEIAQSESVTGKPFVHYWMHGAFMTIDSEKMAKSKGNIIKLEDLATHSITPLAYRYWLLTAHYRSPVNFTYEALKGAEIAFKRLKEAISVYPEGGHAIQSCKERFQSFINDDLDMPKAIALVWDILKDDKQSDADKRATILDFDRVFGLGFGSVLKINEKIPDEIKELARERDEARKNGDWKKADQLRKEIESKGFEVSDTPQGVVVKLQ